jgi:GNAT superfamily N-acetyltransferase
VQTITVERLRPDLEDAFFRLHSEANDAGWCRCVAWWVPTWDGWGERTAEENHDLRCSLFARGEHDVLLAFDGDEPVGSCQLGPRDRLVKLTSQLELAPDPTVWAVSCFLVAPAARHQGIAAALLSAAVDIARATGGSRLEGYPRPGAAADDGDAWTGPERLFVNAGFDLITDVGTRRVYSRTLRAQALGAARRPLGSPR